MSDAVPLLFQIAAGVSLAACAGLRAFLPLFATGLAARLGWLGLSGSFSRLSSTPALVVLGVAVVVEVLSDKIPFVDHALDLLHGAIKPAAGTVLAAAMLTHLTPLQAMVLGLLAGGGSAGLVHLAKAKVRVGSTLLTAGLANPFVSLVEDAVSVVAATAAILAPVLAAGFLLASMGLVVAAVVGLARRGRRTAAATVQPA